MDASWDTAVVPPLSHADFCVMIGPKAASITLGSSSTSALDSVGPTASSTDGASAGFIYPSDHMDFDPDDLPTSSSSRKLSKKAQRL